MADVKDAFLVAVVLQGEDTYWLAEVRGKPLEENWQSANCFWLYPVHTGLAQFTTVRGFEPSDSIYEVDRQGFSKVLRSAALAADVKAKRYTSGRSVYYFVPQEELQQLDTRYKMVLKREALGIPPSAPAPTKRVEAKVKAEIIKVEERNGEEGEKPVDGQSALAAPKGESTASSSDSEDGSPVANHFTTSRDRHRGSDAAYYPGSHKRREAHRGTSIYIAPESSQPVGSHCSSEAFDWGNFYIVHRGSADFLCPEATGNTYGFRLTKVTHNGFPVFLLFGSAVENSSELETSANGVEAMETSLLTGEGVERQVPLQVLVLTRAAGDKKRSGTSALPSRRRARSLEWDSDDDNESSDENFDDEEEPPIRRERRPTKMRPSAAATKHERKRTPKPPAVPLQCVGVNQWSVLTRAVPDAEQLAQQFAFACDTSTPLRTTVFPDGTAVTYPPAVAEKLDKAPKVDGSRSVESGNAADAEMRGLLEHIQLAKQMDA